jgi:hypothetical protein
MSKFLRLRNSLSLTAIPASESDVNVSEIPRLLVGHTELSDGESEAVWRFLERHGVAGSVLSLFQ